MILLPFLTCSALLLGWTFLAEQLLYRLMQRMCRAELHPFVEVLHTMWVGAAAVILVAVKINVQKGTYAWPGQSPRPL